MAEESLANAKIAGIRRQQNRDLTATRQMLNQAAQSIRDGDLDTARQKLLAVKDSGADLGWFDNAKAKRQLAWISENQGVVVAAVQPTPASNPSAGTEPATTEPKSAGSDLLTQARLLYAQQKLAEAREQEQQGNYRLALRLYEETITMNPDDDAAKAGQAAAEAKVGQQLAPQGVLEQQVANLRLRAQQVIAEFNQLLNQAKGLEEASKFDAASEAVQQAKVKLDRGQQFLSYTEYKELRQEAEQLAAKIDQEKAADDLRQVGATEAKRPST